MKVETYNVFNPDARVELNFNESIKQAFTKTDQICQYIEEIKPGILIDYVFALKKRLANVINDFNFDVLSYNLEEMSKDLIFLKDHVDLLNLILQFIGKQLELPRDYQLEVEEIEVLSLNHIKSLERLSYHRTKACADILGDEKGIHLWKGVVSRQLEDERIEYEKAIQEIVKQGKKLSTSTEIRERDIKRWTEIGLGDFTVAIFDDDKVLYRFDRCLTHEALKDLDDPNFAYLCSCYIGDAEGYNFGNRYLRRTQTLHHGDFCDEFYWDPRVHNDPKQPSLDFTRKLGR